MKAIFLFFAFLTLSVHSQLQKGLYSFVAYNYSNIEMRHCDYELYATQQTGTSDDFYFNVVPAQNGNPNGISLQSLNYPDHYVTVITGSNFKETGRLGIATTFDVNDASFSVVSGLAASTDVSFVSLSKNSAYAGKYITLNNVVSGDCSYSAPAGDVYLTDGPSHTVLATWKPVLYPPPPAPSVTVNANNVTHQMNKYFMGCHSDSGYVQQPRGFYAQMIYGDCFEEQWNTVIDSGVQATVAKDSTQTFNTKSSMKIAVTSGTGFAGVTNRGLGNEGLVFYAGKDYDGYAFVKTSAAIKLFAAIEDYESTKELASETISVSASGNWQQVNFTFTSLSSTTCVGITPGSDPQVNCGNMGPGAGHICVKCAGQFKIGIQGTGTVNIGYVYLQPGTWGRYKGLPVLQSAVDTLTQMGITSIRQGGTFSQQIVWKAWRGPPTQRASMGMTWGSSLISGWGLFEMIDLCNAAGIEPIITLSESQSNQDWSDLVEYCYGNSTTQWGAQRIADGHPNPYVVNTFELGNEQYNSNFVAQVQAMEAKAKSLGVTLYYMFPTNEGLNSADANKAQQDGLPINRIAPDIHVGGGGAVEVAESDFNAMPSFSQSAINCETNAGIHTHARAMQESFDLMDWFNVQPPVENRLLGRTASFCTERSGHYDNFDQGLSFFLPNMTWLQPPGYVHQMINQNWLDQALGVQWNSQQTPEKLHAGRRSRWLRTTASPYAVSAQKSSDNTKLVVQIVNDIANPTEISLVITNFPSQTSVKAWTLANSNTNLANPPSNPTLISPVQSTMNIPSGGGNVTVPAYSFTVLLFTHS